MIKKLYYSSIFDKGYDVIALVIWGQSNARGNTLGTDLAAQYQGLIPNAQIYDYVSNQWVNLNYPTGAIDGLNFGIEFTFAYMANQIGTKPVLIGKRAEGGTDMNTEWQPGTQINTELKEAIAALKARVQSDGYTNPYYIFYGNQGESDRNFTTQNYIDKFTIFWNDLLTTQNISFNQVIMCKPAPDAYSAATVRAALDQLAITFNFELIDMEDYTNGSDGVHYENDTQEALGIRVYNALNIN